MPSFDFQLFPVDEARRLFISPRIVDWGPVRNAGIEVVIDLEGGIDDCVPTAPGGILYVYFPIFDEELPDIFRLHAIGRMGADLVRSGQRILSHCGMGFNRSALVAGVILVELGVPGPTAVEQIQTSRPGALFNECFAKYLRELRAEQRL